jgi:hypothetical protein
MALDISSDKDSESVRAEVEKAVRGALGDRIQNGNWVATVRRLPQARAYILDVSNLDGFMRQWVFAPGDLEDVIRQDLQKPQP